MKGITRIQFTKYVKFSSAVYSCIDCVSFVFVYCFF